MAMNSDDESEFATHHRSSSSISKPMRFNFDDAFSDTEDTDVSYEFSAAAIRAELEKNLSSSDSGKDAGWPIEHNLEDLIAKIGYASGNGTDASVSTFDINAGYSQGPSPPMQHSPSPGSRSASNPPEDDVQSLDEVNLTSEFSSVNLRSPSEPELDHSPFAPKEYGEEPQTQFTDYPAVQIDLSQNHPEPIEVHVEAAVPPQASPTHPSVRSISPSTPPHDEQMSSSVTSSSSHPITPRSAQSTSSIQIPSSPSLPTPSTAASNISTNTVSAVKHRATRSAGPSMLDKIVSKTRPTFLPPKPKAEDMKHQADWEAMMKKSRLAGESSQDIQLVSFVTVDRFSSFLLFGPCSRTL
jgi:TBC1 domain family member 14